MENKTATSNFSKWRKPLKFIVTGILLVGGFWLASSPSPIIRTIGIILALIGIFSPALTSTPSEIKEEAKKVVDVFSEKVTEFFAPLGRRLFLEFEARVGLKGGDHIPFFVFGKGPAYLSWLLDFIETGVTDSGNKELVVFLAKDDLELSELIANNPSLEKHGNLFMRTLSGLPHGAADNFFANVKPWVDDLVKEIITKNDGKKFEAIRLITSDLEPLYMRKDFVSIKRNFNRKFEQFLAAYEYLRGVPFFSMATYRLTTFLDANENVMPNVSDEIRIILSDSTIEKALVLTEDSEMLSGEKALQYLFSEDELWKETSKLETTAV